MEYFDDISRIEEYIKSPKKFIETFCYITTKEAEFKLMKLNKVQNIVNDYVEKCLKNKKKIRIRILKSRQLGMSTYISALGFWVATMHNNSSYAVVAHNEDSTKSIFDKNKIFYDNLPDWLKPKTDRFNSEMINYDYSSSKDGKGGLKSKIFFGTAGGKELFRGQTILFMHKSEKAFWENNSMLNKSLNPAVPKTAFSFIIDETTANGYNFFKDEWDASVKGDNDYKAFFFGWDMNEEYQQEVEEGFKLLPIEEEYMLEHDLTMKQMRWRRSQIINEYEYTIDDIMNDDIDDFYQEMPLTPEEAFRASGRSVFSSKTVAKGLEYSKMTKMIERKALESFACSERLEIWEEPEIEEKIEYDQVVRWNKEKQEYEEVDTDIIIGKRYKYGNYLIAIDTSGSGQDWNVISVWHTYKKRKVAQWKKKNISEENLAKIAVEIATMYNKGMIAPETNYSHSLVSFIEGLGYKNLYIMENMTRVDKKQGAIEYGWKTTTVTKPIIVSVMKRCLNEDYTICPDREFWEEAEYYIQEKSASGKDTYNAANGHHDDIVMSSMIGRYLCDSLIVKQEYTIKKSRDDKERGSNFLMERIKQNKGKKNNNYRKGIFNNYA